jgi:signal recognition particle GTPase
MSQAPTTVIKIPNKETFGEKVRKIADQLKQETNLQIKATSRILGAAAQIANNHDRLIDEVVEMVEEDLIQQDSAPQPIEYTIATLKEQFKSLNEAKLHFGVKASSWAALVNKLNRGESTAQASNTTSQSEASLISKRLDAIESEIQVMHVELRKIFLLLEKLTLEGKK